MAKIYEFHIYSHENEQGKINKFYESQIQIKNELGQNMAIQLSKEFADDNNVSIANEISPPGERGGGGEGPLFPISTWIWIGFSIYVTIGKGFFDELGKDLARRLLKFLFDKKATTEITIQHSGKAFTILIPPAISKKHVKYLEEQIQKLKDEGKYIYSSDSKKVIKID